MSADKILPFGKKKKSPPPSQVDPRVTVIVNTPGYCQMVFDATKPSPQQKGE